jgi:hypothetical protein
MDETNWDGLKNPFFNYYCETWNSISAITNQLKEQDISENRRNI